MNTDPHHLVVRVLGHLGAALEVDWYRLTIDYANRRLRLDATAAETGCEECLFPKDALATMALSLLADYGVTIEVGDVEAQYPADPPREHASRPS